MGADFNWYNSWQGQEGFYNSSKSEGYLQEIERYAIFNWIEDRWCQLLDNERVKRWNGAYQKYVVGGQRLDKNLVYHLKFSQALKIATE